MRRRGFTLIEVTVALAVALVLALIGVRVGRAELERREQAQFFAALVDEWDHLRHEVLLSKQGGSLLYNQERIQFQVVAIPPRSWVLRVPASVILVDAEGQPLKSGGDILMPMLPGTFTQAQKLYFRRSQGGQVTLTFNIGGGMITSSED
ncbi:prepilin-type N-terminal cleavage/methylation domain-containing protein [Lacticaseibacillus parakribbianus]|uniref:prepilin-type N-terminal cleavage/methylation domain-containing protein n=1 Tax=Lacticaseibacillus parakribbianus TaxID=2970927 RepID=UPI0021CB7F8B|nr:prepilin-type N-terminal cleavage/methylation domain-containing protein [Lacticaseibacillus parakribbianus]